MKKEPFISAKDDNTGKFDGNEFYFSLTASDTSKTMNFAFNNKVNFSGFTMFWENAPIGSNIDIEILDAQDALVMTVIKDYRISNSNTSGKTSLLPSPGYLCDNFKLKITVSNGDTAAPFKLWGLVHGERMV